MTSVVCSHAFEPWYGHMLFQRLQRERERERETDRQTDRQTDSEKERERKKERERERERAGSLNSIFVVNDYSPARQRW